MAPRILNFLLIFFFFFSVQLKANSQSTKPRNQISGLTHLPRHNQDSFPADGAPNDRGKLQSLQRSKVVLNGNATIQSENKTFVLGFFSTNGESNWYLGIWFASIPIPTYVWVANRDSPIKNQSLARLEITSRGKLAVMINKDSVVWETNNTKLASEVKLLEQGNLLLLDRTGGLLWQSFDFPTDTWLPGMNLTAQRWLTSWKSSVDPSPGDYSLRLRPPEYGEIALFYNDSYIYWSTGEWTGNAFAGVPQMTIRYIYKFYFNDPSTQMASFGYSEVSIEPGVKPPLTRFQVDHTGQLKQYTWSVQTENWNMFWSQPENLCSVYGLCGSMGFCNTRSALSPCKCFPGFEPWDDDSWNAGDFSGGCFKESNALCSKNDGFKDVGMVSYDEARVVSFSGTWRTCQRECLGNCSCIGLHYNERTSLCKNLYGDFLNLRNLSSDSTMDDKLWLRVQGDSISKSHTSNKFLLIGLTCGVVVMILLGILILLFLHRRIIRKRKEEEEAVFPVTNLRVFSYKELHAATKGFCEKLGHGGFGAVFLGELSDSSLIAVKRLDRPGGGEKEFQAEVCTIGNIQHINLVRLRGFCCENSQRLLVYDYMPNGPLSAYLRRGSQFLNWEVRFQVAMGVARGIAYLHEECRNCIIHCDIKPENILLDQDFSAKVSDFGLAKLLGRDFSRVLATMRGTWGYVAPEWISGLAITTKADVYSYGMTILELIGGRRNVEGPPSPSGGDNGKGKTDEKWFFPPWAAEKIIEGNIAAVIDEKLQGKYNASEAERVGQVAVWCIQDDESVRPTMGMVLKMLEGVVEIQVPPPPKLLQALVSGESFRGNMASQDSAGFNFHLSIDSKDSSQSFP